MANYYSIKEAVIDEIDIKKSRFITYLIPIKTEEDFTQHLSDIRKEHYKATHHCQAFILNEDASIQRMSDDGEPSGTAGLPMLEVLKMNDLTYIMAVTVRYYGGTKLGAGGLIRAYSSAVSSALDQARIIANVTQMIVGLTLDYNQIDQFNYYVEQSDISLTIIDTQYTDKVYFKFSVNLDQLETVKNQLTERFNGQLTLDEIGESRIDLSIDKEALS